MKTKEEINNCKECYKDNKTPNIEDCNRCKMPKKYIIKNCLCFDKYNTQCLDTPTLPITEMVLCKDITNCVMKQIVEKLKPLQIITFEHGIRGMFNAEAKVELKQVSEILNMLEIEECE